MDLIISMIRLENFENRTLMIDPYCKLPDRSVYDNIFTSDSGTDVTYHNGMPLFDSTIKARFTLHRGNDSEKVRDSTKVEITDAIVLLPVPMDNGTWNMIREMLIKDAGYEDNKSGTNMHYYDYHHPTRHSREFISIGDQQYDIKLKFFDSGYMIINIPKHDDETVQLKKYVDEIMKTRELQKKLSNMIGNDIERKMGQF